ncbi:MAG: serine/threonine-protein phosphatase [Ignavibacteria bacterium]|jgi:hypothetical protein|nr:serine/threonine-protein phosphatase [Ignavibacteria bacterium]
MDYEHIEIELNQQSKHSGMPCGDVFYRVKTEQHTTIILCDGKGHGIRANTAATMNVSYLAKLMSLGFSQRVAFNKLADFLRRTGATGTHYSVFTIARILNDGATTILSYEMPPPLLVSPKEARVLPQRKLDIEDVAAYEVNCYIKRGEAIMLMSDGVTNAGIGRDYRDGWGSENLCNFISSRLNADIDYAKLSKDVMDEVYKICKNNNDDDVTNLFAHCRKGGVAIIFTGPPTNKEDDVKYVRKFISIDGVKIVCGGTTSKIISNVLNRKMKVQNMSVNEYTPPQYEIQGIDLAAEGAITLNQLYNVIDEKRELMHDDSPVTKLYDYIMQADKVIFYLGSYNYYEEQDINFIQRGIKTRRQIVPLIADKLRVIGKLVVVEWI